jgi:hypothetical protein
MAVGPRPQLHAGLGALGAAAAACGALPRFGTKKAQRRLRFQIEDCPPLRHGATSNREDAMQLITKAMNEIYLNERTDRDGSVRREKFETLEARIASTLKKLAENEGLRPATVAANLPKIGAGRVKSLVSFHETRAAIGPKSDSLSKKLIELRQWLSRQGAQLTRDGKVLWRQSEARVFWDTDLARQALTKVEIRGPRLFTSNGKPLDTRNMVTHFSGPGYAIYVMSQEGNLHVSTHSAGMRHHSSLLGGVAVAGAGELRVTDGVLLEISNKSGHYWPEPFHMVQVLKQLIEDGVPELGYKVICRGGKKEIYDNARECIATEDLPAEEPEPLPDTPYGGDSGEDE